MHQGAYLVGIAGGSGSGKTSLVRGLQARMSPRDLCLVTQDDYYLPREDQAIDENGIRNYDLPTGLDLDGLAQDLLTLASGFAVERQEYTFNQEEKVARTMLLEPAPIILVEGLFVLHHLPIRELLDLAVFVEASEQVQLERRILRDGAERGYGQAEVMYQWERHVKPAYHEFLRPYRDLCDLHVLNERSFDKAMGVLTHHLQHVVKNVDSFVLQPA